MAPSASAAGVRFLLTEPHHWSVSSHDVTVAHIEELGLKLEYATMYWGWAVGWGLGVGRRLAIDVSSGQIFSSKKKKKANLRKICIVENHLQKKKRTYETILNFSMDTRMCM